VYACGTTPANPDENCFFTGKVYEFEPGSEPQFMGAGCAGQTNVASQPDNVGMVNRSGLGFLADYGCDPTGLEVAIPDQGYAAQADGNIYVGNERATNVCVWTEPTGAPGSPVLVGWNWVDPTTGDRYPVDVNGGQPGVSSIDKSDPGFLNTGLQFGFTACYWFKADAAPPNVDDTYQLEVVLTQTLDAQDRPKYASDQWGFATSNEYHQQDASVSRILPYPIVVER
jgi:hypothetical protein